MTISNVGSIMTCIGSIIGFFLPTQKIIGLMGAWGGPKPKDVENLKFTINLLTAIGISLIFIGTMFQLI